MTDRRRIAVLVSGSGSNLQALLDAIADDPHFGGSVVVVATDRPGCGGVGRARTAGIPTVEEALADHPDRPAWEKTLAEGIAAHAPDLVVLAGFMRVLSTAFLERWPGAVVNIHPALLPAFPGAHGVRDALEHGVKVTGTTVHVVDEEVDHGPIIGQAAVDVHEDDTEESLHERIKEVEHRLLPAVVKLLCHDRIRLDGHHAHVLPAERAESLTTLDVEERP